MKPKRLAGIACLCLLALLASAVITAAGDAPFAILATVALLSAPASVRRPAVVVAAAPSSVLLFDPAAARAPPLA